MGVIYLRTNKINGKKYVGQATDLEVRQNRWNNLNQPYAGPAINRARAKYGIDNFGFEILKECKDEELDYWEKYYIKELNTKAPYGYNLTEGGGGMSGYTLSEETRKKISEGHKGLVRSQETRKKLSEGHKGLTFSEEHKKKISETLKGRKRSEEAIRKMAEAHRGKYNNTKKSKPVLQIDKDTNEVIAEFPSASEVQRQLGFIHNHISACCKGKRKTAYGFIWKYKESVA